MNQHQPGVSVARHIHWIVVAYRDFDVQSGNYIDTTSIDVLASSYAEAMQRAMQLVPKQVKGGGERAGYHLVNVIEHIEGFCK